jgi:GDPmannose 4,6-dehydratase
VSDGGNITRVIEKIKPDEIYNLAGMSHVHVSFGMPELTADVNALGPLRILEALCNMEAGNDIRMYQASSSEMFGRSPAPQNEQTPFEPCSPYGTAKLYAYWSVCNYREAYGLHASNGILFNHESALRGEEFVTRKITKAIGEIEAGKRDFIELGNLDSMRDWGHARDYMEGAWSMLQQDKSDDYVLATGQAYSVRDFVERAFQVIDVTIEWRGEGLEEFGVNFKTDETVVKIDPNLFRPTEINQLIGDASKASEKLNWAPKISFDDLVEEMVQADRVVKSIYRAYGT